MIAKKSWSNWSNWTNTLEKTLDHVQKEIAGDAPIAELRTKAGKAGTGNVLDVDTMATEAQDGACWVLSSKDLHDHFGSKHPTKHGIEGGIESFLGKLKPGQSVAVTSFTRGLPTAVLFAGWPRH